MARDGHRYATFWSRCASTDVLSVQSVFLTAARGNALAAKGITSSFCDASKALQLSVDETRPVANCFRTGRPSFVADARRSTLRRATLAAQYGIRSIVFRPFEGVRAAAAGLCWFGHSPSPPLWTRLSLWTSRLPVTLWQRACT